MKISKYLPILFLLSFSLFSNQEDLTFEYVKWGPPGAEEMSIIAWKNNKKAGYILLDIRTGKFSKKGVGINNIEVEPQFRKEGIGTALMNEAQKVFEKKQYEKIRLTAKPYGEGPRISHSALIDFYQKHGFKKEEKRTYWRGGVPMVKVTPYYYSHYFKNLKRYFPITMNPFE